MPQDKNEGEYTPGPWNICGDDDQDGLQFIPIEAPLTDHPGGWRLICDVKADLDEQTDEFTLTDEDRANARLIAASPTMLSALKLAEEALARALVGADFHPSDVCDFTVALEDVRSALAKAHALPA